MALTRIWASFIIISVLVALIKIMATDNKMVFSSMVTGKAGDTVRLKTADTAGLTNQQLMKLDSSKFLQLGNSFIARTPDLRLQYFQIQSADGIIETCKGAVTICFGLIGIMALFMG